MERAKRLELRSSNSEEAQDRSVANFSKTTDTQLSTHAAELAEIAEAWAGLGREIQAAVLTLVRVASNAG